jgi:hypothetical protein
MTTLEELASRLDNPLGEIELSAKPVPAEEPKLTINKPEENTQKTASVDFPLDNPLDNRDYCVKRAEKHFGRADLNTLLELKNEASVNAKTLKKMSDQRTNIRWVATVVAYLSAAVGLIVCLMPLCNASREVQMPRRAVMLELDGTCKDNMMWAGGAMFSLLTAINALLNSSPLKKTATRLRDRSKDFKELYDDLREATFVSIPLEDDPKKTVARFQQRYAVIDKKLVKSKLPRPSKKLVQETQRAITAAEIDRPAASVV